MVIDRNWHGLYFSGPIDRYMALATGEAGHDILSMARQGLRPRLRDAIERAFRTRRRVTVRGAPVKRGSQTAKVTIEIYQVAAEDDDLLLISFADEPATTRGKPDAGTSEEQTAVARLHSELEATRKELNWTIRDFERSNEELKGANEEVVSMNEELQATNEELETSKEELQSLNEELTTLNIQLRQSLDAQSVAANDLTNLLNGTGIATLSLDALFRIKFFNPPAADLFRVISTDVGRPLRDLSQTFADPNLLADAAAVLASGTRLQREVKDDRGTWYNLTILPARNEIGTVDGVVITFADITAVKIAEMAAEHARRYAETIIRTTHEPLVVFDAALRIVSANQAFLETFALPASGVIGRMLREVDSPVLRDAALEQHMVHLLAQPDDILDREITILMADGHQVVLRLNGRHLRGGAPDSGMILLAMEDFTERRRSIEQQFQVFLNAMPEPMMIVGEGGRIRWINGEFERLFGYTNAEAAGQMIDMLVPEGFRERHLDLHGAYLRDPTPRPMARGLEVHGLTKDSRVLPLDILLSPFKTSIGMSVLTVVRDISERQNAERVLNEARAEAQRANRAKSRFLQAASHDLRQPLQAISLLQGVLTPQIASQTGRAALHGLEETVEAMKGVVDSFLDISQIESGTITPNVVAFPVRNLLARLQSEYGPIATNKALKLRVVESSLTIRSDPRLLQRIFGNLMANAVKHTPSGRILLGCRRQGAELRIEVWDTGIGIPAEHLGSIFDEFYQVRPAPVGSGSSFGVGLYIVRQLAALLGHAVAVRSAPGKGTVFSITVPMASARLGAVRVPVVSAPAAVLRGLASVLVVEDDEAQRDTLKLLLSVQGYQVKTARSLAEAMLRVAEPPGFHPDLILADYNLGDDRNGVEVVRQISARSARPIPALIMSGDVSAIATRTVADAGYQLLRKPVRLENLLEAIGRLVGPAKSGMAADPSGAAGGGEAARGAGAPASVAIVDDDTGVRVAMRDVLAAHGYHSVGHSSAESFLADPDRRGYRCALVDVGLPGMDGLALQRQLAEEGSTVPLVFITGSSDLSRAVEAMRNGAADFLEKPVRAVDLLATVSRIQARPDPVPSVPPAGEALAAKLAGLTKRQRDVMERVIDGKPSKVIAAELNISQRTVEHHRSELMRKAGARSVVELVRLMISRAL